MAGALATLFSTARRAFNRVAEILLWDQIANAFGLEDKPHVWMYAKENVQFFFILVIGCSLLFDVVVICLKDEP